MPTHKVNPNVPTDPLRELLGWYGDNYGRLASELHLSEQHLRQILQEGECRPIYADLAKVKLDAMAPRFQGHALVAKIETPEHDTAIRALMDALGVEYISTGEL